MSLPLAKTEIYEQDTADVTIENGNTSETVLDVHTSTPCLLFNVIAYGNLAELSQTITVYWYDADEVATELDSDTRSGTFFEDIANTYMAKMCYGYKIVASQVNPDETTTTHWAWTVFKASGVTV